MSTIGFASLIWPFRYSDWHHPASRAGQPHGGSALGFRWEKPVEDGFRRMASIRSRVATPGGEGHPCSTLRIF
jgi:hypothetical protein